MSDDYLVGEATDEEKGLRLRVYVDVNAESPRDRECNVSTMVCWHRRYNLGDNGDSAHPAQFPEPQDFLRWWNGAWEVYNLADPEEVMEECDTEEEALAAVPYWMDSRTTPADQAAVRKAPGAGEGGILVPLYLIDHSGITMRAGRDFSDCDPGGWDSGIVGFAYVTREKMNEEWPDGFTPYTHKAPPEWPLRGPDVERTVETVEEWARLCIDAEVEEYAAYLEGACYGYVLEKDRPLRVTKSTPEGEVVYEADEVEWEGYESCWGFFGDYRHSGMADCLGDAAYLLERI